LHEFVQQEEKN